MIERFGSVLGNDSIFRATGALRRQIANAYVIPQARAGMAPEFFTFAHRVRIDLAQGGDKIRA